MRSFGSVLPGISAMSIRAGLVENELSTVTCTFTGPFASAFLIVAAASGVDLKAKPLCVSSYGMLAHCRMSHWSCGVFTVALGGSGLR